MGHINIQCVNNKIDQVRLLLESGKNDIHVFGLSETKLNAIHPDPVFICPFEKWDVLCYGVWRPSIRP